MIWQGKGKMFLYKYFSCFPSNLPRVPPACNIREKQFCELICNVNSNWEICNSRHGKYSKREFSSSISTIYLNCYNSTLQVFSDSSLEEWDLFGNLIQKRILDQKILDAHCHNDLMAISSREALRIYSASSKQKKFDLEYLFSYGNRIVVNDEFVGIGFWDGSIKVFSTKDPDWKRIHKGHPNPIYAIDVFGNFLLTGSSDRTVKLWNIDKLNETAEIKTIRSHRKTITDICFLPQYWDDSEAKHFVSCSKDKTVCVYDVEYGREITTFSGHTEAVNCVKVLSSERIFSGSKDGTIKLWDSRDKFCAHTFLSTNSYGGINSLYVDPYRIFSGHESGSIVIHELYH